MGNIKLKSFLLIAVSFVFTITGISCVATSTSQAPPPMIFKKGEILKAAFLPIGNTNAPDVADLIILNVSACLEERKYFHFTSQDEVNRVVNETGFDMGKIFGLEAGEYKILAEKLGVDYLFHGTVTLKKDLTFAGWRRDVDAYIQLYNSSGEKQDSWRAMTEFSFGKIETIIDAKKMGTAVANSLCSEITQSLGSSMK